MLAQKSYNLSLKNLLNVKKRQANPFLDLTDLTIDFHILNFTALSVVGVLQYSLLPLAL